jgi:type II secretory pathway component PulJ
MRKDGFIFIELLLALAISAIAISLFWQSSNNRIRMLSILEEKYAFSRLSADATIIRASGESINI